MRNRASLVVDTVSALCSVGSNEGGVVLVQNDMSKLETPTVFYPFLPLRSTSFLPIFSASTLASALGKQKFFQRFSATLRRRMVT